MKQILQNISNGETLIANVPAPRNKSGDLLIESKKTLISSGTERMLMNFGKASYIDKARQQPDKVKEVLKKIKTDGLLSTIDAIQSKLDQPMPLGYCNAGTVLESETSSFKFGDRVVSNGPHAEIVRVPKNLCAKIPDNVDDDTAAFTVLASIGLQGIRLAKPTLGETIVVSGLGLIGQLTVQMLIANGCKVLGIDFDSKRCKLAETFGATSIDLSKVKDPVSVSNNLTQDRGVDAVIVTASTESNELMHQAASMCRKRGRIILVGVAGLKLNRDDFYEKELTFQVSSSYGPGRYDPKYEEQGNDYPLGFVRWTEQRNFEAVLEMMSMGKIDVKPLISRTYDIDDALEGYKNLDDPEILGILIDYPSGQKGKKLEGSVVLKSSSAETYKRSDVVVGFIGAGNYASRTLIPAFKKSNSLMKVLISDKGISGHHHSKKNDFYEASTVTDTVFDDPDINTVVIATRHNLHAQQVLLALKNNKNIFVEKPLAITIEEIEEIDRAYKNIEQPPRLMVGFNRRFSPYIVRMRELLSKENEPKSVIMTINAGFIPKDHWTQDPHIGGGRIIGEACHFIDLMQYLISKNIESCNVTSANSKPGSKINFDEATITLSFLDGSIGTIHYFSSGSKAFPKERIEAFCNGGILQLDNFRSLKGYDWNNFNASKSFFQNKGQLECVNAFTSSIEEGKPSPIPYDEIIQTSRLSIEIADQINQK